MRTHHDAKPMARALREALAQRDIALSHAEALEIVARQFGFEDWNILAARIAAEPKPGTGLPSFSMGTPILRIFALDKAREFYLDFLGFTLDWEHRFGENFPIYVQVSRAGLQLHLSEHHGDASPGSTVFVPMRGIEAFHAELTAKAYAYSKPGIQSLPWGRQVEVPDPFGNRIRFCERPDGR